MVQLGVSSHPLAPLVQEVMKKRPIDGVNDFESRNLACLPGQCIAAVHPRMGPKQTGFGQPLQNLGQQLGRNSIGVGDILGAQAGVSGCSARYLSAINP